jgi:hypothetical protein
MYDLAMTFEKPSQKLIRWKTALSKTCQLDRFRDRRSNGLLVGCRNRAPNRQQQRNG